MKKLAVILLILGAAIAVSGICVYISAYHIENDNGGYGALARGMLGMLLIGLAILLAASSAAVFIDMYIKNKRKGQQQNEPKN